MDEYFYISLAKDALELILTISAPVLIAGMIIGLLVSITQTVTSIQDSTLSIVPKMAAMLLILFFMSGWIMNTMLTFTRNLLGDFTRYIR